MWEPPPPHLANGIIQGYKVIYSPAEYELQGRHRLAYSSITILTLVEVSVSSIVVSSIFFVEFIEE